MTSTLRYRITLAGVGLLAAAGLITALGSALAFSFPFLAVPVASDLATAREGRALLDAEIQGDAALSRALSDNQAILATSPMNTEAWLRKAYLQTRNGARLNAESLDALERSYAIEPLGARVAGWRIRYVFGHWDELTPSLRRAAAAEYRTVLNVHGRPAPTDIENRAGRLAATLIKRSVDRHKARDARNSAASATQG